MPRSLAGRIGLAFVGLSLAFLLAVGATLFVVLRGLHESSAQDTLANVSVGLVVQRTRALVSPAAQETMLAIRDALAQRDISVGLVLADGRLVGLEGDAALPLGAPRLDVTGGRGTTRKGTFSGADGTTYDYAVTTLRAALGVGPRALLVASPDRSRALAIADLLAALPAVGLVLLLVGSPIGWLLARSVVRPLRRLGVATAAIPTRGGSDVVLPLDGPAEVRELTQRFNAMQRELAGTREREAELLANLRHDLRTPLTVIEGFATALADGTATGPAAERAATAIVEESERLERLVGELGAIERLRNGPGGLRPEQLDAGTLLTQTAERFAARGRASGVSVEVLAGGPNDPPLHLAADRQAVERMLANLVDNALAALAPGGLAGSGGHVWLAARPAVVPSQEPRGSAQPRRSAAAPAGAVTISVTDDGPGFPAGATERVFERFFRADPARSGTGSGLGLSIVRELARAHGGEAYAENLAPRGARVTLVLPIVPPPTLAATVGVQEAASSEAQAGWTAPTG